MSRLRLLKDNLSGRAVRDRQQRAIRLQHCSDLAALRIRGIGCVSVTENISGVAAPFNVPGRFYRKEPDDVQHTIGIQRVTRGDADGVPAARLDKAAGLPISNDAVDPAGSVPEQLLAVPDWQSVSVVCAKVMCHVTQDQSVVLV